MTGNGGRRMKVIISSCYGAGWSTWQNYKHRLFYTTDNKLIKMLENKATEDEVSQYCFDKTGELPYMDGWKNCIICSIPDDCKFRIDEYDGNESIITDEEENSGWIN